MLRAIAISTIAVVTMIYLTGCETDKAKVGATIDTTGNMVAIFHPCKSSAQVSRVQLISYDHGKRILWDIKSERGSQDRQFTLGILPVGFSENTPYSYDGSTNLQWRIESSTVNDQESFSPDRLSYGKVVVRGDLISLEEFAKRDTCP